MFLVAAFVLVLVFPLGPGTVVPAGGAVDGPRNCIFFDRERHRISERGFLEKDFIAGAQLEYPWREIEPPGRRPCPGIVEHRLWPDEGIRWQCPRCADNGITSNWQSTAWDRREVQPVH